jgi:hypothetical protein
MFTQNISWEFRLHTLVKNMAHSSLNQRGVTLNLRTKKLNRDHCRSGSTQIKQTKKQSARVFKIIKKELLDGVF